MQGALSSFSEKQLQDLIIAYEPVWAIGTGKVASDVQAQLTHEFIRKCLGESFSSALAEKVVIQYGGSMKPANAKGLLAQKDIDGGLIGGASLITENFLGIINA